MKKEPIFKPEAWVRYEFDDNTAGFGKIRGASFSDDVWHYAISGAAAEVQTIPEDCITHILENNNWTKPSSFSGSNSAYANVVAP